MFPPRFPSEPSPAKSLADAAATLRACIRHYEDVLLPMWLGPGWNAQAGLCHEALTVENGALVPTRTAFYRTMACARQLYTFARATVRSPRHQARCAERASALCQALDGCFRDRDHGGWLLAIDPTLAPHDTTKDLYTHAFVLFASAHWLAVSGDPRAAALVDEAREVIAQRFAQAGTPALPVATMDAAFSKPRAGVAQNPVMHLTEAYLAAAALPKARAWASAGVRALTEGLMAQCIDARTGCIAEQPIDAASPDNRIEPGHQFEWFYLVRAHAEVFDGFAAGRALADTLDRAVRAACQLGVETRTQGVCLSLRLDGRMLDPSQRIWAQTEYGRALSLHAATHGAALAHMLRQWSERFLHARGWHEVIDAQGQRLRIDMPASTPYHLTTFYEAAHAALAKPDQPAYSSM